MSLSLRILAGVLALLAIAVIAVQDIEHASPGPLIATHAQVEDLQGSKGCVLCHGSGPSDLAPSCLECHAPVARQIRSGEALHGRLTSAQQKDCGSCHSEHLETPTADWIAFSFRMAALEGPEGFQHQTVDYHLDGRHASLACLDCHEQADADPLPAQQPRFLGKIQDCTSCHEDPHEGTMRRSCASCHGQEHPFDDLKQFPHVEEIPLHGSHAGLDCRECHKEHDPYSVEALSDPDAALPWRTCKQCHEDPHSDAFLDGQPDLPAGFAVGEDACARCHAAEHENFHAKEMPWEDRWHQASGFSLTSPHDDLACVECHAERTEQTDFQTRYPGRLEKECSSCHEDPHEEQFQRAPYLEEDCRSCHTSDTFASHDFTLRRHAEQGYPLLGAHETADCASCHEAANPSEPHSWVFHGTTDRCDRCHTDVHDPPFAVPPASTPTTSEGDCATCHQATGFRDLTKDFDHEAWTGFALTQGHEGLDCESCHARSPEPDIHGRTLGLVAELHPGDPSACQGCHEDVHQGTFDKPQRLQDLAGAQGCARCHGTRDFRTLKPSSFDHDLWTDYPLTGAHRQSSCASCHGRDSDDQPLGKVDTHFPGDWKLCSTCHADPHDGAFDRPEFKPKIFDRADCHRCHGTNSFRDLLPGAFDHGYWTGFPLRGAHLEADCTSCHAKETPSAESIRLGTTAGSACTDCHTDPHEGQFQQSRNQDCLSCHDRGIQGFELPDFDHTERTRFELDPTHAALACSDCHGTERTAHGTSVVRYVPLGTDCVDCHAVVPQQGGGR